VKDGFLSAIVTVYLFVASVYRWFTGSSCPKHKYGTFSWRWYCVEQCLRIHCHV